VIPNVKCIVWNFDGSNVVGDFDKNEVLNRLSFENGDIIPNVESYFVFNDNNDDDNDDGDDDGDMIE
jgi:hypothetical protein